MPFDLTLVGQPSAPTSHVYRARDVIAYALGIGARRDELAYLYEGTDGAEARPRVFPTYGVVPAFDSLFELLARSGGDLSMIVFGGQRVRLHRPFAPSGTLSTSSTIRGIHDMRVLAVVRVDSETKDEHGALVCESTATLYFRGAGGFGGEPAPKEEKLFAIPRERAKEPDFRVEEATSKEQALLYRLSGDVNPLHADPDFAAKVGFTEGPILHGLCTYGHMMRHVAKVALGGDPSRLTSVEAQFKKAVLPGDTLVTEGWNVGDGRIALQVKVKERDEVVISSAGVTYT